MALAWIASYPKSGNTWTRILLASYLRDRQVEVRLAQLGRFDDAVPDLVTLMRAGRMPPLDRSKPLALKTHFLPGLGIHDLFRAATTKVIYLVRNPRDVIPSAERMLNVSPDRRTGFDSEIDPDRVRRAVQNSALDKLRRQERRDDSLRFRDHNPAFFGQGLSGQSLTDYGDDIEQAYRRLLQQDEEFSSLAGRFGYTS